jgi:hypothetical protein
MEVIVSPGKELEINFPQGALLDEGDHIPYPEAEGEHATDALNSKETVFSFG